jgi:prophage regulatory protein
MFKRSSAPSDGTAPADIAAAPIRFIRIAEVKTRTGLSKTEIYARIKALTFPRPLNLSPYRVAWIESEIVAWQESVIAARRTNVSQNNLSEAIAIKNRRSYCQDHEADGNHSAAKRSKKGLTMKTQSNTISPIRVMQNNAASHLANLTSHVLQWDEQNAAGNELALACLKDIQATGLPALLYRRMQQLVDANVPEGILIGFYQVIAEAALRGSFVQ